LSLLEIFLHIFGFLQLGLQFLMSGLFQLKLSLSLFLDSLFLLLIKLFFECDHVLSSLLQSIQHLVVIVCDDLFLLLLVNIKIPEMILSFLFLLSFFLLNLRVLLLSQLLLLSIELFKVIQFLYQCLFFLLLLVDILLDGLDLAVIHSFGLAKCLFLLELTLVKDCLVENEVQQ
jgi:hypothetical protein